MQPEKQNLSVIVFPSPTGYVAVCLELSLATEERTKKQAAKGIAKLINANISSVREGVSTEALRYNAPEEDFRRFEQGNAYGYKPRLSPEVMTRYGGIEFRTYSS